MDWHVLNMNHLYLAMRIQGRGTYLPRYTDVTMRALCRLCSYLEFSLHSTFVGISNTYLPLTCTPLFVYFKLPASVCQTQYR